MFVKLLSFLLPWSLRYRFLNHYFHYNIHPTARIGFAWIFPKYLAMDADTKIDHFSVAIHLDSIIMDKHASIGRSNWITGFPVQTDSLHFKHQPDREAKLHMEESAAITKHHHIDCTSKILIKRFATVAGYYSQLLTHAINIEENRQDSAPITIGEYSFVGTNAVLLGGATLPAYSVLGAKSLLNKSYNESYTLYAGVPSKPIKTLPRTAKYFNRLDGFVY